MPLGCPTIVLPRGALADGRPAGMQLVGAPGYDEDLLEVTLLYQ
mgnify:CR=1 FL=1